MLFQLIKTNAIYISQFSRTFFHVRNSRSRRTVVRTFEALLPCGKHEKRDRQKAKLEMWERCRQNPSLIKWHTRLFTPNCYWLHRVKHVGTLSPLNGVFLKNDEVLLQFMCFIAHAVIIWLFLNLKAKQKTNFPAGFSSNLSDIGTFSFPGSCPYP